MVEAEGFEGLQGQDDDVSDLRDEAKDVVEETGGSEGSDRKKRMGLKREGGKVVFYYQSVRDCQNLAKEMGCEAYFHDAANKTRILERFVGRRRKDGDRMEVEEEEREKSNTVVATSAFGMGIDVSDIRVIVNVNEPGSMLEYEQESGRWVGTGEGARR